jgi:hypothetical protein
MNPRLLADRKQQASVAGDQTRNFINCMGLHAGSSNYCILRHQKAIGRERGGRLFCLCLASKSTFDVYILSAKSRTRLLPLHILLVLAFLKGNYILAAGIIFGRYSCWQHQNSSCASASVRALTFSN